MNLIFDGFSITDEGVEFFLSGIYVSLTDAELSQLSTPGQLVNALEAKIERKYKTTGLAAKLQSFVGQEVPIEDPRP